MEIYQAREKINDDGSPSGLFHYTVANGSGKTVYPVGYCANDCPGHATAEEAEEHYRQFELDNVHFNENPTEQRRCQVCGEWTQGVGYTHWKVFYLCLNHQTRDVVDQLTQPKEKA